MKYDYKCKSLAKKIKEILQENFPKDKSLTDIKSALLNDHDFILKLTNAIKDDFTLNDMNCMFTKDEICSLIDGDDLYYYFDSDEMLDAINNDTIVKYLKNEGYGKYLENKYVTQDEWMPIDHIIKACQDISPRTLKTAEDMKRIVCDEIDKQDTGNIVI